MSLVLTEEQAMLRDSARDFLAEQSPITALRALRDQRSADGFSRTLWAQFAEMGFTGVLVPESHGGLGLGPVEAGVVMEQIGHQLCASPLLATGIVAVSALRLGGSAAQQQAWLGPLASGKAIATLAVDESAKHRPTQIATTLTPTPEGLRLDGAKTFVLDGHVADLFIVAARDAGTAGTVLCLVPAGTPGVTVERTVMADAHNAARVQFHRVQLPADALLAGAPGAGGVGAAQLLEAVLDAGRCAAAAELLGLADEVFERTVNYLKERKQFGRLIGEFQALQHRAAALYCDLELARAAVAKAQQALLADPAGAGFAVAVAKARAGRSATLAVQEGVQMHGGMGMTDEFDIGLFMKRARVLQELWGDANFHQDRIAAGRGY
jgi:alkylation response protein AidB-like acyl-CoA dehydrogenase